MDKSAMWNKMISIIKQDVTPATGCTEPIALAYAAATAARELGEAVRFVDARVSANLMKNGMGVTVPGTGDTGALYCRCRRRPRRGRRSGITGPEGLDARRRRLGQTVRRRW